MMRKVAVIILLIGVLARGALAEEAKGGSYWSDGGYGVVCALANVLYMPTKVVYASLGLLTGSLAYLLTVGDSNTAESIWSPSLGGSYVVTPAMLRGDEPVLFNGPSYSSN